MATTSVNSNSSVNSQASESSASSESQSQPQSQLNSQSHSHHTNPEQVICNNNTENGLDNTDETLDNEPVQYLDTFCNPDNPVIVNFHDITAADALIKDGVDRTPCRVNFQFPLYIFENYIIFLII